MHALFDRAESPCSNFTSERVVLSKPGHRILLVKLFKFHARLEGKEVRVGLLALTNAGHLVIQD